MTSQRAVEKAHDILEAGPHRLDALFRPRSVAVIGATERAGSVGRTILWNLVSSPFGGTVYPVNPKRPSVLGIRAYPDVRSLPESPDLAVIVTPAATVPDVVAACAEAGAHGAIVISAGFREVGPEGAELERRALEAARAGGLRLLGPNCLGAMLPPTGLNATFASTTAHPGRVGFVSQSGALCTAILDWSLRENVGFSAFISIGAMADIGWGDLIDWLGEDRATSCIVLYMESVGDARSFLSAAREVAQRKPIVVIKAGESEAAAQAAASHTGSLAGSDDVLDAAFRRSGVLRVRTIAEVFYLADVLDKQPRPRGPRLGIVTNAGGPGVLATDALDREGGELSAISDDTRAALDDALPAAWSHGNPVDVLGDADPDRYAAAADALAHEPTADGLLVILTPQAMSDPTRTAERLAGLHRPAGKPMLASWMGGAAVQAGREILTRAEIPNFPYPDTAARVFSLMWRYTYNLRGLYETPQAIDDPAEGGPDRARAEAILASATDEGRSMLLEDEAKALIAAYGVDVAETRAAETAEEAVAAAEAIGYPVAVKLRSRSITHKSDVGGVRLHIDGPDAARDAFAAIRDGVTRAHGAECFDGVVVSPMIAEKGHELIVGSSLDAQFGPILLFGLGGTLVEIFRDRAIGLPPLNTTLARRMMEQTRVYAALRGARGEAPVDLAALERLLVRFSRLVAEQPRIREMDINPLLATPNGARALDARVILHDPSTPQHDLPRAVIRPYPAQYAAPWTMPDGARIMIRPLAPEDEPLLARFHESLSERSVYARYFQALGLEQRVAHERLARMCFLDYDRSIALVADRTNPETGAHEILAVGRLSKVPGTADAEFALLVADPYQGCGLGGELLRRLIRIGEAEGLERITAEMLLSNHAMQRLCRKHDFVLERDLENNLVHANRELGEESPQPAEPMAAR